ncbi:SMI1/KNR4 family protein [Fusobacterium varium]|uniref:SMI1/KNR4 family protein n=1 Tax=Fusobacterium varium TaxID=856 RepID=UPI0035682872
MSIIMEKILKIEKLYYSKGSTDLQIEDAQKKLEILFPKDYIEILKTYGAISFYGTEWTGLNVDEYIDVIACTLNARIYSKEFPAKMFVLEELGIENILILCDEEGNIYSWKGGEHKKIADSLVEYLEMCICRKINK